MTAMLVLLMLGIILVAIYFLPTILALMTGHQNTAAIIMLNVLAGWTVVGWMVAMVWSCTNNEK